jgi:hypothetical protein
MASPRLMERRSGRRNLCSFPERLSGPVYLSADIAVDGVTDFSHVGTTPEDGR